MIGNTRSRHAARIVTRRSVLIVAGLGCVAGCTSEADRTNDTVFGAIRKDPLYAWRPSWAITFHDTETPLGGPYPESGPRLRHSVYADRLPPSAVSEADAVAIAGGWAARGGAQGYMKPIENSSLALWVMISTNAEFQSIDMTFTRQNR